MTQTAQTTPPPSAPPPARSHRSVTDVDPVQRFALLRPPLRRRRPSLPLPPPVTPVFFAGPENVLIAQVAVSAVEDLARQSPLILIGRSGVGKTTLAVHLAERFRLAADPVRAPARRLDGDPLMISADDFSRQFASAIASGDTEGFRRRIDGAQVWVVDGLQSLRTKPSAQSELAARLDARQRAGRVSILTTPHWPCEQPDLRPQLVSRLTDGLSILLQPPGDVAAAQIEAELRLQHFGPAETRSGKSNRLSGRDDQPITAREIEAMVRQEAINLKLRRPAMTSPVDRSAGAALTGTIIRCVARQTGVTATAMRSGKRQRGIVQARSMAMYLCRQLTDESLQSIGRQFGGRDHTTVMHALQKIETLQHTDAAIRRVITDVRESVG